MIPFLRISMLVAPLALGLWALPATATVGAVPAKRTEVSQPAKIVGVPAPRLKSLAPKPIARRGMLRKATDPRARVSNANRAARVEPSRDGYLNGIQQYPYADGSLYQVYAAPGRITDIALQEGEELTGSGPVAAGDTARWIIGDTSSGTGTGKRVHILVKPTRSDIGTNLIINTDRRTYHLELRATPAAYMASVSWNYPLDALIALKNADAQKAANAPVVAGLDLGTLSFGYRISGDKPAWRPVRVFDDGRRVMIEFPEGIATGEMPPLFIVGEDGSAELVNYRVQGRYIVVDRLFSAAELRLGTKKTKQAVRIEREGKLPGGRK